MGNLTVHVAESKEAEFLISGCYDCVAVEFTDVMLYIF